MHKIGNAYDPAVRRFFIDTSYKSLKGLLLYNGNRLGPRVKVPNAEPRFEADFLVVFARFVTTSKTSFNGFVFFYCTRLQKN